MPRDPETTLAPVDVGEAAEPRGRRPRAGGAFTGPGGLLGLAALAVGIPAFYVALYVARGYGMPVGSDAPVYLWWERLAALDGLSVVRMRPGMPALTLVLEGALRLTQPEALAAVGVVAATSIGLAAAIWVGKRAGPWAGLLGGVLAATYAADMVGGYYANAVFAGLFVAAIVLLLHGSRREAVGAAALLGAGGLAHPIFLLLGLAIMGLAVAPSVLASIRGREPIEAEARRLAGVGLAALGVLGAAWLAMLAGPDPHAVDTSADAFRRRTGLFADLGRSYYDRFRRRLARYVLPVSVALAWAGTRTDGGLSARLLTAWGAVAGLGVGVALATQRFPAARFLGFALVLPIGAAFGLVRLWRWLRARVGVRRSGAVGMGVALVVCGGLAIAMVAGGTIPWRRQKAYLNPLEIRRATAAGEVAAERTPTGTPIVVVVDGADPVAVPFLLARAANVARASVPPERIRDVLVYLGSPASYLSNEPTSIGDRQYDAFSAGHLEDVRAAVEATGREPAAFVLAPFARPAFEEARGLGELIAPGVIALEGPAAGSPSTPLGGAPAPPEMQEEPALPAAGDAVDAGTEGGGVPDATSATPLPPLSPSSSGGIVLGAAASLLFLFALGLGWSRAIVASTAAALALAPAFGTAAVILAGVALERLGVPLTGTAGPVVVSAVAGGGGYLLALLGIQRSRRAHPST